MMKLLLLIATALPFITCQQIVGGTHSFQPSLTDHFVILAINGINDFYKTNGDQRPRVGESIVSATSQVVAGIKYTFDIEVSGGDVIEVCRVIVWSRAWLPEPDKTIILGNPTCAQKV